MVYNTKKGDTMAEIDRTYGQHVWGESPEAVELSGLTYADVFERYAAHELGVFHADQELRYSKYYGYDRPAMLEDLGDDVHPVTHGLYTHNDIVQPLLSSLGRSNAEQPTAEVVAITRIAALVHDFGECEHPELEATLGAVVGDVPHDSVTEEHKQVETTVLDHILTELYPEMNDELRNRVLDVVMRRDDEIGTRAFELAEYIGYYRTGLRAGMLAARETAARERNCPRMPDDNYRQLVRLGRNVSYQHRNETLPIKSEGFTYGSLVLSQTTQLYDAVHSTLERAPAFD